MMTSPIGSALPPVRPLTRRMRHVTTSLTCAGFPAVDALLSGLDPRVLRLYASRSETCASPATQLVHNLASDLMGSAQLQVGDNMMCPLAPAAGGVTNRGRWRVRARLACRRWRLRLALRSGAVIAGAPHRCVQVLQSAGITGSCARRG